MSKNYMAGYAGYQPGAKFKGIEPRPPETPTANIPGYSGYVFAYGPENVYGKTFSAISKEIKCTNKYGDRDNFEDRVVSITKESYVDPKTQDNDRFKIPSQNKFVKRTNFDVEKDNFMAVECRERMLKSLGSGNLRIITEMLTRKIREKKERESKKPLKLYPPIVGYSAANRQVAAANLYSKDWQSCRKEAKKLIDTNNDNSVKEPKTDKFGANIFSDKSIKKMLTTHISRFQVTQDLSIECKLIIYLVVLTLMQYIKPLTLKINYLIGKSSKIKMLVNLCLRLVVKGK